MKQKDVKPGQTYTAKVNGRLQKVRTEHFRPSTTGRGTWACTNIATGRLVFKSAAQLRPLTAAAPTEPPQLPYGPGIDGPEVGQGIDAPWLEKPWAGEFPVDKASDMDPAAVRILHANMQAGKATPLASKTLETVGGAFVTYDRTRLVNGDRADLQSYLEARGFAVYAHEPTDLLRETALEDYDGEKG